MVGQIKRKIKPNLYYSSLKENVQVLEQDQNSRTVALNATSEAILRSYTGKKSNLACD
jgi:hypothetical protein